MNLEIVNEIIVKLGLEPTQVLRKSIRGKLGITYFDLIYSLVNSSTLDETADLLGYSTNAVSKVISEYLHPLFKNRRTYFGGGDNSPWRKKLFDTIQYKQCCTCDKIMSYTKFCMCKTSKDGVHSECTKCHVARNYRRKEHIAERTPPWADLLEISRIYSMCPEGYHVDHVIPLRGKLVSGLHVLENLQYLKIEDNLQKSNKYVIE